MADRKSPTAVVVGCSAGGVHALSVLLASLRADLPCPVVIVCHSASEDVASLCEVLSTKSKLQIGEAKERHLPSAAMAYLAPPGYHLLIEADGRFSLSVDERVCYCRPAIDVLFCSAATAHGERLVGIVLTGANEDGAEGLKAIRAQGGLAIVQCPDDALASIMPAASIRIAGADHVVPLVEIATLVNDLFDS